MGFSDTMASESTPTLTSNRSRLPEVRAVSDDPATPITTTRLAVGAVPASKRTRTRTRTHTGVHPTAHEPVRDTRASRRMCAPRSSRARAQHAGERGVRARTRAEGQDHPVHRAVHTGQEADEVPRGLGHRQCRAEGNSGGRDSACVRAREGMVSFVGWVHA